MQLNLPMPRAAMRATTTYYKFLSPSPLEVTSALVSKIWRGWGGEKKENRGGVGGGVIAANCTERRRSDPRPLAQGGAGKSCPNFLTVGESTCGGATTK